MVETITSSANPLIKRVRLLQADRKHRRREGAFVVEGIQPTWRAVEAGWEIDTVIACPPLLEGSPALTLLEGLAREEVRVAHVSPDVFSRLSERDGPSGLAAIVRSRVLGLDSLRPGPDATVVVLDRVSNPGNLGTILRTADAAGAEAVVLVGDSADAFAPAAVKASMGSLFAVPVVTTRSFDDVFTWARTNSVHVVATSGYASHDHWKVAYPTPLAVVLGNEGEGLPDAVLEAADLRVRIPMTGTAESLNLSVAAAVMLYEVRRGRVG